MALKSGRKRLDERLSLQRLFNDDDETYEGDRTRADSGFSVRKTFPVVRSYGPGGPTYLQLAWALEYIRCWKLGIKAPTEEAFVARRGIYRHGNQNRDEGRARKGDLDKQRAADRGDAAASLAAESEADEADAAVDHLPQVQEGRRHDAPRRKGGKRPDRVRPR